MVSLKFSGVYSEKLLENLQEIGIEYWGFDFDPKSFNFIQMDQVNSWQLKESNYFDFHFKDEKELVVTELLKSFDKHFPKLTLNKRVVWDGQHVDFLTALKTPYIFVVKDLTLERSFQVINDPNCRGVVFDYNEDVFTNKMPQLLNNLEKRHDNQSVGVRLDWGSQVNGDYLSFLPLDYYEFTMGTTVENGYRNPDINLIERSLSDFKQAMQGLESKDAK